jgi:hypothetical protein
MSASRAAATIAITLIAVAKKKRKRVGPAMSADTVMVSSRVETINIEDDEDNTKSPSKAMVPPAETTHKATTTKE